MSKILVIGSSNTDLVVKTSHIPEPGETVLGGDFMMAAGGKGANQAVAAARLGGDVAFIAKVGNDMFGKGSIENYKKENMDISHILVDQEAPSGVALISVDSKAENCIVVAPGANNKLSKADIDSAKDLISSCDYILMQLEIPMEVIEYVAEIAFAKGKKIILNPAPAAPLSKNLISKLYLITPNKTESRQITGMKKVETDAEVSDAADALLKMGAENVVITLGTKGSFIKTKSISEMVPAIKVKAVDTTAAGDTFSGALCVALSEGNSLLDSVKFATKASSISVTKMGAQSSIPYRKEII